ncbi:MAG TPA: hypothetical protein VFB14_04025 [Bryobacteraceae bacterium]|nr:hypothetical protein [Bryobacteraceae bacterium]
MSSILPSGMPQAQQWYTAGRARGGYGISCKVCDRGTLLPKKRFRMSPPVVVIGFILLIPSVCGIAFAVLLIFGSLSAAGVSGVQSSTLRRQAIAEMRRNDVPPSVIRAVLANPDLDADDLISRLPMYQISWIKDAEAKLKRAPATVIGGAGMALFGSGFAVIIGIGSFIGGLLGWLLVMRRRVLQCTVCGAAVDAG